MCHDRISAHDIQDYKGEQDYEHAGSYKHHEG